MRMEDTTKQSQVGRFSSDPQKMLGDAQESFVQYLSKTDVEAEEWMIGSTFTGFSSEQGYGIIVSILRGEKELSGLDD